MTLYHCPACGALTEHKYSCPNYLCGAFLMLPCIEYSKEPLANIAEEFVYFVASLE